jgi:hypothetical protein
MKRTQAAQAWQQRRRAGLFTKGAKMSILVGIQSRIARLPA